MLLILALGRRGRQISEFEARLVYGASSTSAWTVLQKKTFLKTKQNKTKNSKHLKKKKKVTLLFLVAI